MQFEKFDKRVKEAAENHHPTYDEQAWKKMEKLLDKHLPQKEDKKRRFLFFLLLFLLLGSSGWLLIAKPWKQSKQVAKAAILPTSDREGNNDQNLEEKENAVADKNKPGNSVNNIDGDDIDEVSKEITADKPSKSDPSKEKIKPQNENVAGNKLEEANKNVSRISKTRVEKNEPGLKKVDDKNDKRTKSKEEKSSTNKEKELKDTVVYNSDDGNNVTKTNVPPASDNLKDNSGGNTQKEKTGDTDLAGKKDVAQEKTEKEEDLPKATESKNKKKTNKPNSLFFSLSAGPDFSFVSSGKIGKTKLLGGAGIGYTIKEKFTLRTGFYTARKIYSALPKDYNAPPDFYQYYPYLESVDADCRVYEIPLTVSYNFGRSDRQNWFVSAGVSSYLMKRETYDYFYKVSPTSPVYSQKWTVPDKNNHFFSVLNLSAGYQRNIGKRFTVMAEPYLKLPLSGVGYGKVKLNSGGVLFTIGFKPFQPGKTK